MDHDCDHVEPVGGSCSGGYQISSASSTNLVQIVNTDEPQNLSGTQSYESTNPEPNVPSNESQFISASNNGMSSSVSITPTNPPQASILEPTEQLSVSPLPPNAGDGPNGHSPPTWANPCVIVGRLAGTYLNNPDIENRIVCDFLIGSFTGTFKPNDLASYEKVPPVEVVGSNHFNLDQNIQPVEGARVRCDFMRKPTFVGTFFGSISRDKIKNVCNFDGAFFGTFLGQVDAIVDTQNGQVNAANTSGGSTCTAHKSLLRWLAQSCLSRNLFSDQFIKSLVKNECEISPASEFSQFLIPVLENIPQTTGQIASSMDQSKLSAPFIFAYASKHHRHRMAYSPEYFSWEKHVLAQSPPACIQQDTRVFVGKLYGLLKGTCALNYSDQSGLHKGQFTGTFLVHCTGDFVDAAVLPTCSQTTSTTATAATTNGKFIGYIYEAKFEGQLDGAINRLGDAVSIDRLSGPGDYFGGEFLGKVKGKFVSQLVNAFMTSVDVSTGMPLTDDQRLCHQWYHFVKHDQSRRDALPNEPTSSARQMHHHNSLGHFASTEASTQASTQASSDQTANGEPDVIELPQLPPQVTVETSNGDSLNVCSTVSTVSNESRDNSTTTSTSGQSTVVECPEDVMEHDGHHSPLYDEPNGGGGDDDDALSSASSNNLLQTPNPDELQNLSGTQSFESTSHETNVPSNESQYISASNNEMSSSESITPTQPPQASVIEPTEQLSVSPLPPNADEDNNDNELALMITRGMVVGQLKGTYSNNPNIDNQIVCDFVIGRFTGTFKPTSSASYAKVSAAEFVGAFYGAISRDNEHDMCSFDGAFIGNWLGKFVNKVDLAGQALSYGELEQAIQHDDTICPAHDSLQLWLAQIDKTDKSQLNSWAQALSQVLKSCGKPYTESDYLTMPFTLLYADIMYQNRMPYSKEYISWEEHVLDTVEHLPSSAQPSNIQQQDTRVFVGHLIGLLKGTCALNYSDQSGLHKGQFTGTFLVECSGKFGEESTSPSSQTPTTTFTGYIYEAKFDGDLLGYIQPLGGALGIDRLSESGDYIGGEFEGEVTGKFVEYVSTGGVPLTDDQKLCLQWYHFIKHDRSRRDFALPNEPTSSALQLQHSDPSGHFASTSVEASTEASTDASNQFSTPETANGEQGLHESEQNESPSPQLPPQVTFEPDSNGDLVKVYSSVATVSNELHDKSTTTASTSGQQTAHFKCTVKDCGEEIFSLQEMSNHFATKHGKRKRFRSKVKCTTEGNTLNVGSTVATASNESHYNSTRTTTTSGPSTAVECTEKDCTRQFDSLVDMRRHLVDAHGLFRLSCRAKGCSKKFASNILLSNHETEVHGQGVEFVCPECKKTSSSQEAARKHYNCHITGHFKCTRCLCFDRMISLSSAQSHLNNTGKMPTSCETEKCNATFTSRSALDQHQYDSHRGTYGQLSSCTFENCHLYSFHKEIMGEHVRTVHGNTQTPKLKRQPEWKREPEQRKKREVTDHDAQQCPPQGTLEPHSNGESVKVYSSVATVSNDLHAKSTTTASTSGQQSALFKCIQKDCSRHFTTLQGMNIHVTSIHPNLSFRCTANSECKKRFNSRSLLKQHLSKVHGQKGLYTCQADLCKALKFDSEAEVLLHMYNTAHHQSFKCGKCICFKWMAKISTAKRHWKRVNTPGGELKCMMKCPSTFHSKSQLDAHRNVAHARCSVVVCCTFHQDCLMCCSDVFRMWEHLRTVHHVNGQFTDLISKYTKTLNLNSEDK